MLLEQIAKMYGMSADFLDWTTGLVYKMPEAHVNPDNENEFIVPVVYSNGQPYGVAYMEKPCLK